MKNSLNINSMILFVIFCFAIPCADVFSDVYILDRSVETFGHLGGTDIISDPTSDISVPYSDEYDNFGIESVSGLLRHSYPCGYSQVHGNASANFLSPDVIKLEAYQHVNTENIACYDQTAVATAYSKAICDFKLVPSATQQSFIFQYYAYDVPAETVVYLKDSTTGEVLLNHVKYVSDISPESHSPFEYILPAEKSDYSHKYELEILAYGSIGYGGWNAGGVYTQINVAPEPATLLFLTLGAFSLMRKSEIRTNSNT